MYGRGPETSHLVDCMKGSAVVALAVLEGWLVLVGVLVSFDII